MKYTLLLVSSLCFALTGAVTRKRMRPTLPIQISKHRFPPEPLSETIAIDFGGLERSVIVHIPEDTPANAPLVIVMHGYSSRASSIAGYSGFRELADREKFIVAFPQGTTDAEGYPFFNVGYAFHDDVSVNDLGFIRFVVETLQDDYAASRNTSLPRGCQTAEI